MSTDNSLRAKAMKGNTPTRIILFVFGLLLIGLGFYIGIWWLAMGSTMYTEGIWSVTSGVFLGFRKRYIIAVMAIGIILVSGFWYNLVLLTTGMGIIIGCIFALIGKKPRPSVPKPPWMAVT